MEKYLRAFKVAGNKHRDKKNAIVEKLEMEGIDEIAQNVGEKLGIDKYSLFRNKHFWYRDSRERWNADDIFEAELETFLNEALDAAYEGRRIKKAEIIGGDVFGNISQSLLSTLNKEGPKLMRQYGDIGDFIADPTFRAIKADVKSFSFNFDISAKINPKWVNFINTFRNANFTVKNYSSKSQQETIHLGNTQLKKAIPSILSQLYRDKTVSHIFYHSLGAYVNTKDAQIGEHILHMRYMYELGGGKLKDKNGKLIQKADYFIYNDPVSNNIWVRSVKDMIYNNATLLDMQSIEDPLTSSIVILKNKFI